jgi:hypothetical protein
MKRLTLAAMSAALLALASCDNPMVLQTKVNEDGSLDKTITFDKANEKLIHENVFGLREGNGWTLKKTRSSDSATTKADEKKYRITFSKHFDSDAQMNQELNNEADTLFHVRSRFEKKFRWLYTYIRYSETIRPINRFKKIAPKDYFNKEDSLFIQRLPSEGKTISRADSLYLQMLNEKIYDRFANMAIFNETYPILEEMIVKNHLDKKWLDTLARKKEFIYKMLTKDQGDFSPQKVIDTLNIPMPSQNADKEFERLSKDLDSRLDFMSFARDGKYLIEFEMPWSVVHTNADSVAGNKLYWHPLVHKFAYMDYEMVAESRQLNGWSVAISAVIIGLTVVAFRRRKS